MVVCVLLLRCFWWQPHLLCLNNPSVSFTENHPPPIITQPLWWLCDFPTLSVQTRWYHFISCFSLHETHYQPLSSDSKQNTPLRFQHNLKKTSGCLGDIRQQVHILLLYFFPSHKTPNTRISPHSKANISLKCLYVPKKVSSCLDDIRQRAGIMLFRFSSHKKISDYSKAKVSLRW